MSSAAVTTERRDGVLIVHLDDGKANALSFEMIAAIGAALDEAESDDDIRAMVLHGRPGRFSAGFDLGVMLGNDMSAIIELVADGGALVQRLYGSSVPVVAASTGHALAAGAIVLLGCDVRIAGDVEAKVGLNEVAIKMVLPDWALTILGAQWWLQHLIVRGVVMAVRGVRFPDDVRRVIRKRLAAGESRRLLQAEFDISAVTMWRLMNEDDAMLTTSCGRSSRFLSASERETISRELACGASPAQIAVMLGRHRSSICREVAANGGRYGYRSVDAEARACRLAARPKATKLECHAVLAATVTNWMRNEQWSPEQISGRLIEEFPDDETMRVAKETIYQELFVYGRGGLKKELVKHLRTRRRTRRSRSETSRNTASNPIPDKVLIAERPDEVTDRQVPGHWEGDLIMGRNNGSQVATLVERTTGLLLLGKLDNKQAATVAARLHERITTLPDCLRRSITWDQGSEMADHRQLTIATDVKVYFCDPHAPGNAAATRTPTVCCANTCPRAPTCPSSAKPTSTRSPKTQQPTPQTPRSS
jgi:transposase, IS30 family